MTAVDPIAPAPPTTRRFLDWTGSSSTVIGPGSVFVGNLSGVGTFVVFGEIIGDGELRGDLSLGADGHWHGNIHALRAVVAGRITGNLEIEDKLEIGNTAVIRGRIRARTVAIATGAIVDGEIEVTSGSPVVKFDEKRDR